MCILLLHFHPSSSSQSASPPCTCPYYFVAADNRDEFFERPTTPLAFWEDNPAILAGRDTMREEPGERGTWLGVSKRGRFAVLTNYRVHPDQLKPNAKTRGQIVSDFLAGERAPEDYCHSVLEKGSDYNGFSLIAADLSDGDREVVYCSNMVEGGEGSVVVLDGGYYGLSNALLDTPWSKVQRGKERFAGVIQNLHPTTDKQQLTEKLLEIMADDTCLHPDPSIPDMGMEEAFLESTSSIFVKPITIQGHSYGTRTSSVVLVDKNGVVTFTERNLTLPLLPGTAKEWTTRQHSFSIQ